jgi:hypothetical protein
VDVFAVTDEREADVKRFESHLKSPITIAFPIAFDRHEDESRSTATWGAFFRATGVSAHAPYSFLTNKGKIVWHGPADDATAAMDEVLATGDAARARDAERELVRLKQAYKRAYASKDTAKASAAGEALLAAARGHAAFLNATAWDMVDGDTRVDLVFALALARAAVEASGEMDFAHLDTLGLALWKNDKKAEALEVQKKAVALCDALAASCPDEKKRLARFTAER